MKRRIMCLIVLLTSVQMQAQFTKVIFNKAMRLNYNIQNIFPLGDQNKDGCDDIMLYDCSTRSGYIYFGGNPMDTIPRFTIQFYDSVYINGTIAIIDLNDDGIKDIVATTYRYYKEIGFSYVDKVRIYYGGSHINSKPDLEFYPPKGTKGATPGVLKDFNGDGRSELVLFDANLPYSEKQYGTYYFYNTESKFDTIPHYIIKGDSVKQFRYYGLELWSTGDINGDGKTDFTIRGIIGTNPAIQFRSYYIGNKNFDLTPLVTYRQDEHKFDVDQMKIINDISGDGKDDILIKDYGYYPYYYVNAILKGGLPIDTIPYAGLNSQNEGLNIGKTYSLGDVNGDGYKDFISATHVFSYQNVKLWLGGKKFPWTLSDAANKTWAGTSDGFGRIISNAGDVNGDGVNDIVIGQMLYYDGNPPSGECTSGRIYIISGDKSVVDVVEENNKELPGSYELDEPYPNPFNPTTTIKYSIPVETRHASSLQHVTLRVYDLLGKEIATLVNKEKQAGSYKVEFDAQKYKLGSGVYFVRMEVIDKNKILFSQTKKLSLTK